MHKAHQKTFKGYALFLVMLLSGIQIIHTMSTYRYGLNLFDEGSILSAAQRIARGDILYKNIPVVYAPGRYMLLAGLFKIFGQNILVERLMWGTAQLVGVIFLYPLSKKLMPSFFAFLACILYIFANGFPHKVFYTALSIPTISLLFIYLDRGKCKWLILSGVFAGLNLFFMQDTGIFMLALGICAIFLRQIHTYRRINLEGMIRELLIFFAPVAAVILPVVFYFYYHNALGDLVYWCFLWAVGAEVQYGKIFPKPFFNFISSGINWNSIHTYLAQQFYYYIPIIIILIVFFVIFRRLIRKTWDKETSYLLIIFAWGILSLPKWILVPFYLYSLISLLPTYIMGCYLLSLIYGKAEAMAVNRGYDNKAIKIVIVASLSVFPLFHIYHLIMFMNIQKPQQPLKLLNIKVAPVYVAQSDANIIEGLVSYIDTHTKKNDIIYSTTMPGIYFITQRPNVMNYEYLAPLVLKSSEDEKKLVSNVRDKAKYIVHFDFRLDRREKWDFNDYAPLMNRFLNDGCVMVAQFGPYKIYKPLKLYN